MPDFRKVKALFHEAMGKTDSERRAFLDQACGTDLDLKRAVEGLLGVHASFSA